MRRSLRTAAIWFGWPVAVAVLLLVYFFIDAEENRRGARLWADCRRELAAKGETVDLRTFIPPGKPEDDLSRQPIFSPLYEEVDNAKAALNLVDVQLGSTAFTQIPKSRDFLKGEAIDLGEWQTFYRAVAPDKTAPPSETPAQTVLRVLRQFDPQMDAVAAALSNPNAYWPIDYERPFDTRFAGPVKMIRLAQLLKMRAVAHMDNGESGLAENDLIQGLRLNQPLDKNFLIGYLVAAAGLSIDENTVWEGLHRHAWNLSQLHDIENALAGIDMLKAVAETFRAERCYELQIIEFLQRPENRKYLATVEGGYEDRDFLNSFAVLVSRYQPRGWWDLEKIDYSLEVQSRLEGIHVDRGSIDARRFPETASSRGLLGRNLVVGDVHMAFDNSMKQAVWAETYRRLACLACRLEEYKIVQGSYPARLDDLPQLPPHLNQEVLSERPFHYQPKAGGYLLYSVGWNQTDEGGVLAGDKWKGDWPWPSP